ncbi:hypothetical protein QBC45DRAFT_465618 [Copromyces sp. CBS 386.78]|nr:hypothetical protein QBC45DRAFT_465618 [Copromyces sp. CBS 386.78]
MESSLKRCEERVRALEEKKNKFESLWEFEEWTGEGMYVDELSVEEIAKRVRMQKRLWHVGGGFFKG